MSANKAVEHSPTASFAVLMERLTLRAGKAGPEGSPTPDAPDARSSFDSDSLNEEVDVLVEDENFAATGMSLSYEKALRTHARYRPSPEPPYPSANPQSANAAFAPPLPEPRAQIQESGIQNSDVTPRPETPPAATRNPGPNDGLGPLPKQPSDPHAQIGAADRSGLTEMLRESNRANRSQELKRCTISVRLNQEESEILRLRAAESGMTVSSYLRSCVLEADQLRAQVKQALAELRARAADKDVAVDVGQMQHAKNGLWGKFTAFLGSALSLQLLAGRRA